MTNIEQANADLRRDSGIGGAHRHAACEYCERYGRACGRHNAPEMPEMRVRPLSDYERDVLSRVPSMGPDGAGYSMAARTFSNGRDNATHREIASQWTGATLDHESAVVVYVSRHDGSIQFGVARCRRPAGYAGRVENSYEISPFPGAWEEIYESQILAVRHTHAI